jgi:cytochrome c peroxidase
MEQRLRGVPGYVERFESVYGRSGVKAKNVAKALAAFEKTIIANESAYDHFVAGDATALDESSRRGRDLFMGKARCVSCHSGPNLTDGKFHNTGLAGDDPGRAALERVGDFRMSPYPFFQTQKAFKTPSLRNVALTAPYMHDGSKASLHEVVLFYNRGGDDPGSYGRSFEIKPLGLDEEELKQIVAFLERLTSPVRVDPPELP